MKPVCGVVFLFEYLFERVSQFVTVPTCLVMRRWFGSDDFAK
jgi:hypothetical protein